MGKFDFLKDIYSDYFGIERLERENEKLRRELGLSEDDTPILETEAQRAKRLKEEQEEKSSQARRDSSTRDSHIDAHDLPRKKPYRPSIMSPEEKSGDTKPSKEKDIPSMRDENPAIERKPSQMDEYERMSIERNQNAYDQKMVEWFAKIDTLYITEESKAFLKKEIEYMRKYKEKIETNYIPFHMQIIFV